MNQQVIDEVCLAVGRDPLDTRDKVERLITAVLEAEARVAELTPRQGESLISVSDAVLPNLREWSKPVRLKIAARSAAGVLELLVSNAVDEGAS